MFNNQNLWTIASDDRIKLEKQFQSLNPVNGFITGNQAKSLFTKSTLGPEMLGKIWSLSDTDKDGQMTFTEFCIAMHLIRRKLEGNEIPDKLPPQLAALFYNNPMNYFGYMSTSSNMYNSMPVMQRNSITSIPTSGLLYPSNNVRVPLMPSVAIHASQDFGRNMTSVPVVEDDWSINQALKPRYRLQFNQEDRNKRGYLTGVEAKAMLVQSGLHQNFLAQIWTLADIDKDGNLTFEEFCIAMYLVEQAKAGKTLPSQLPQSLLPSSFQRKGLLSSSMSAAIGSQSSTTTNGFQSKQNQSEKEKNFVMTGEDERRANYLKGQAELEKRRVILETQMQMEEENRKAKEKAEFEKLEKIRMDKEQARMAEIQRQIEFRRQQELDREDQIRRAAEERERTRLEAEKNRLIELERGRLDVAIYERRQEEEQLTEVNGKKGNLTDALAKETAKKREIQSRIDSTQSTLNTYKIGIGSMREHRDRLISSTDSLKGELQVAKAELSRCQREKQNLELQLQSTLQSDPVLEQIKTVQSLKFSHREKIKQLDKENKDLEEKMTKRGQKLASNRNKIRDIENKVTVKLINDIKKLQSAVREKKKAAFAILKRQNESNISPPIESQSHEFIDRKHQSKYSRQSKIEDTNEHRYFTALYDFDGRQDDELSFGIGDTIVIDTKEQLEPISEWLYGYIYGTTSHGMFPKTFVKPLNEEVSLKSPILATTLAEVNYEPVLSPAMIVPKKRADDMWVKAMYEWHPESSALYGKYENQLTFEANQMIRVIDTDSDDWWTGEMTTTDKNGMEVIQTGWFPRSYVASDSATNVTSSNEDATLEYSSPQATFEVQNKMEINTNKVFAVTLYPYESSTLGDLNMETGDTVEIMEQGQDWSKGQNARTDQQGLFPSEYVKIITAETFPNFDSTMRPSQSHGETDSSSGGSTPEIVEVMIEFSATGDEQLSLQIGQMVQVLEKSHSGWWKGEIQQRGQKRRIGWFPGLYVKSINSSQTVISDPNCSDSGHSPLGCVTPTPMIHEVVELCDSITGDQLVTMYNYTAQNVDELTFEKDAILVLIDKNEAEWWMGRNLITNQEGLFPVNYVRRIDQDNLSDQDLLAAVEQTNSPSSAAESKRPTSWYVDGQVTFTDALSDDEEHRQFYIRELFETEKVYYDDLQEVKRIFIDPIKASNFLSENEMKEIFLNWTDLIPNSKNFYMALKIRKDRAGSNQPIQSIGDILLSNFPNFIVYVRFCSMQNQAIAKLQKKQQLNPQFKELCEQCESDLRCQKMPMTSFFLKPMQRITKYKLLVENILKHTEDNHPDRSDMEEAAATARGLCESVNEGVRERENSERLEWLQEHVQCESLSEKLYFNSDTNCLGHRKILYSGTLYKAKSNKKEFVAFLFNDFLLLATPCYNTGNTPFVFPLETSSKDKMQLKIYKKPIRLNKVMTSSGVTTSGFSSGSVQSSNSDVFTLKEGSIEHVLRALSTNDRDKWVERIMAASMYYINTENSKRERSMSMRRTAGVGRLLVTVVEGINLNNPRKEGKSDSFCEVSLGNQLHRTKVVTSSVNPKWNLQMQFLVKNIEQDVLCLTVYNKDYFAPNDFLGRTEVSVSSVVSEKRRRREALEKKLKLMEVDSGELLVKLDLVLFKKK